MTISSETRRAGPYAGNGATQVFAFDFKTFASGDLVVVTLSDGIETILTLNSDYTVSLNPDQNTSPGGTITALTAPAIGTEITIISRRLYLQALNLQNAGAFLPENLNRALDNIVIQTQQLLDQIHRMPRGALSDEVWNRLPAAAERVNGFLGFDDDGQPAIVSIDSISSISGLLEAIVTVASIASEVAIVAENDVDVSVVADNITEILAVYERVEDGSFDEIAAGLAGKRDLDIAASFAAAPSLVGNTPVITTAGYAAPGDGGGGQYLRADTEPPVQARAKFISGEGVWYWLKMARINPLQLGADPSGSASSAAALDACFAHAAETGAIVEIPECVLSTGFVSLPAGVPVEMHPRALIELTGATGIRIAGPGPGSEYPILADLAPGATYFDSATAPAVGADVMIFDDYRPVSNRSRQGEIKRVLAVEGIGGGAWRVHVDSAITPMRAPGGYLVSRNAAWQIYGLAPATSLDLAGTIRGLGSPGDQSAALQVRDVRGLRLRVGAVENVARRGVHLSSVIDGRVEGSARDINRVVEGDNQLGYAFLVSDASEHIRLDIHAWRCGKLFDNGENAAGRHGTTRYIDVTGSHKAPRRQGFGTHAGGEFFRFHDIFVEGGAEAWAGCFHRIAELEIDNCRMRDTSGQMSRGIHCIANGQLGDVSIRNCVIEGGSMAGISVHSRESENGSGSTPDEDRQFQRITLTDNTVRPSPVTGIVPQTGLEVLNNHGEFWANAISRSVSLLKIEGGSYAGTQEGVYLYALGGNITRAFLDGVVADGGVDGLRVRHNNTNNRYVVSWVATGGAFEGGSGYGARSEGGTARGAVYARMRGGAANQANLSGWMNIGASGNSGAPWFSSEPAY